MAKTISLTSKTLKATIYFLFLAITLECANSARVLDEVEPQPEVVANPPEVVDEAPVASPIETIPPSGEIPATMEDADPPQPEEEMPKTTIAPVTDVAPVVSPGATLPKGPTPVPATGATVVPVASATSALPSGAASTAAATLPKGPTPVPATSVTVAPVASATSALPSGAASTAPATLPKGPSSVPVASATSALPSGPTSTAAAATASNADPQHPLLSFFMHDILGGSHPSARVVTGIVANSQINGIPFSKSNGGVFPINGGVPLLNGNNDILNDNNVPFLTGLNGGQNTNNIIQNNGNNDNVINGGNTQPFVTAGQLPGATLQKLMFGSITVIEDELTEGHELGSAVLGKAQGFYLASSLDGSSHTMALTALFHGSQDHEHDEEDTISLFGVHRSASPVSQIAIIGGTGKYENAKGYATIETLHQEDQHTTDGVDTVMQFSIYLSP